MHKTTDTDADAARKALAAMHQAAEAWPEARKAERDAETAVRRTREAFLSTVRHIVPPVVHLAGFGTAYGDTGEFYDAVDRRGVIYVRYAEDFDESDDPFADGPEQLFSMTVAEAQGRGTATNAFAYMVVRKRAALARTLAAADEHRAAAAKASEAAASIADDLVDAELCATPEELAAIAALEATDA